MRVVEFIFSVNFNCKVFMNLFQRREHSPNFQSSRNASAASQQVLMERLDEKIPPDNVLSEIL